MESGTSKKPPNFSQPGQIPEVEIRSSPLLVPAAEFFETEAEHLRLPGLNDSNRLTSLPEIDIEYQPPSLGRRIAGLFGFATQGIRAALVEMKLPPDVTAGDLLATVIGNGLNGPDQETYQVSPPSIEEEIALDFLHGDYLPPRPQTEGDRVRLAAFQDGDRKYGLEHVLGVQSMFNWIGE